MTKPKYHQSNGRKKGKPKKPNTSTYTSEERADLVKKHARLVHFILRKKGFHHRNDYDDLVQEGLIGLWRAAELYNPVHGTKFISYAALWIKAKIGKYMHEDMRHNSPLMHDVANKDIVRDKGKRPVGPRLPTMSIDAPMGENEDSSFHDILPAPMPIASELMAEDEDRILVRTMLLGSCREPRELLIARERLLSEAPKTLEEVGDMVGVTREAIRQIECKILGRTKARLTRSGRLAA